MKKPLNENREWYVVDLEGRILGRAATEISKRLMGKHKATFSRNLDFGDYVVGINAEKIVLSGNKIDQKQYHKHTGYIGNLKTKTVKELLDKYPEKVIQHAVNGMLPKNKLRGNMLKRFKIYAGDVHPHQNVQLTKIT